jgi:hypothetical protein
LFAGQVDVQDGEIEVFIVRGSQGDFYRIAGPMI